MKQRPSSTPRRGRPRRIDADAIVRAALDIGPDNVSMRGVAEYLGVSLSGLYHHVRNQDELLELVARVTLTATPPPRYDGQHWASWLRDYAVYIRTMLTAEPALLEKFLSGAVEYEGEPAYVGDALEALCTHGLSADAALDIYAAVTELALGAVSEAHREYVHAGQGRPWLARIVSIASLGTPETASPGTAEKTSVEKYPSLRAIAGSGRDPFTVEAFHRRVTLLLTGIAAQYGLPPEPVAERHRPAP